MVYSLNSDSCPKTGKYLLNYRELAHSEGFIGTRSEKEIGKLVIPSLKEHYAEPQNHHSTYHFFRLTVLPYQHLVAPIPQPALVGFLLLSGFVDTLKIDAVDKEFIGAMPRSEENGDPNNRSDPIY